MEFPGPSASAPSSGLDGRMAIRDARSRMSSLVTGPRVEQTVPIRAIPSYSRQPMEQLRAARSRLSVPPLSPISLLDPTDDRPPAEAERLPAATNDDEIDDIVESIRLLGTLHEQGVLTEVEFATTKADLLARI